MQRWSLYECALFECEGVLFIVTVAIEWRRHRKGYSNLTTISLRWNAVCMLHSPGVASVVCVNVKSMTHWSVTWFQKQEGMSVNGESETCVFYRTVLCSTVRLDYILMFLLLWKHNVVKKNGFMTLCDRLTLSARIGRDAQLKSWSDLRSRQGQEVLVDLFRNVRFGAIPRHPALVRGRSCRAYSSAVARCPSSSSSWLRQTLGRLGGCGHGSRCDEWHLLVGLTVPGHVRVGTNHVLELDETSEINGTAMTSERRHVGAFDCRPTHHT